MLTSIYNSIVCIRNYGLNSINFDKIGFALEMLK